MIKSREFYIFTEFCWLLKNIEDARKPRSQTISKVNNCQETSEPPKTNFDECCPIIELLFDGKEQTDTRGFYVKTNESSSLPWNYQQIKGYQRYLYYNTNLKTWYINEKLGHNGGYVKVKSDQNCPENLPTEAFSYANSGTFSALPNAKFICRNAVPESAPDACITGEKCRDCVNVDFQGELYCCNNYCGSAKIGISSKNGCTCGPNQ